jgi:hypothetical protein
VILRPLPSSEELGTLALDPGMPLFLHIAYLGNYLSRGRANYGKLDTTSHSMGDRVFCKDIGFRFTKGVDVSYCA